MAEENLHHNTLVDKIPHKPSLKTRPSHFLFLKNGVGIFPAQNRTVGFALLKWSSIYTSSSMLLALMTSCRNTAGLQEQTLLLGKMQTSILFFFLMHLVYWDTDIYLLCSRKNHNHKLGGAAPLSLGELYPMMWNKFSVRSINKQTTQKNKKLPGSKIYIEAESRKCSKTECLYPKKDSQNELPLLIAFSNAIFNRVTQGWFPEGKPAYSKYLCSLITNVTLPVITHSARS